MTAKQRNKAIGWVIGANAIPLMTWVAVATTGYNPNTDRWFMQFHPYIAGWIVEIVMSLFGFIIYIAAILITEGELPTRKNN